MSRFQSIMVSVYAKQKKTPLVKMAYFGCCSLLSPSKQILLRKYRINIMIKLQKDKKLATYPRVLVHDFSELLRVGEDHGSVFVKIVFDYGLPVCVLTIFLLAGSFERKAHKKSGSG